MKLFFNVTKLLTGALFVFSGLVKLNDPSGFSIKLNEYFDVFAEDVAQKQDSVQLKVQFDFETRIQQNFILYPSDQVKKVQVETKTDSLQGSDIDFKWGGMEGGSAHFEKLKALPKQIHAFVISSNCSILEKSVSLDSTQQSLTEFQTSFDFDIQHLVKSPGLLSAFSKHANRIRCISVSSFVHWK